MIWNTIAHPRMMVESSEVPPESGENNAPIFSEEALASPIKHMNRDLLATFDIIVMTFMNNSTHETLKTIPLLGDFDTVYHMAKTKAIVSIAGVVKILRADEQTGSFVPVDGNNDRFFFDALCIPMIYEGKLSIGETTFNFKDDRFVVLGGPDFLTGGIFASNGVVYDADTWSTTILPKYKVNEESGR